MQSNKNKILLLLVIICIAICHLTFANATDQKDGWSIDGDYVRFYIDGVPVTGKQSVGGKIYNFTDDGILTGNGHPYELYTPVDNGSQWFGVVYPDANNKLQTGWYTVDGHTYYFYPDTKKAPYSTRSYEIDGKKYAEKT